MEAMPELQSLGWDVWLFKSKYTSINPISKVFVLLVEGRNPPQGV